MSARSQKLRPERVREVLDYEPETGRLIWKRRPREMFANDNVFGAWNTRFGGRDAFTSLGADGYRIGAIDKTLLLAHRVAWAFVHGRWPEGQIDHINGDRTDNRIDNLREVSPAENHRNRKRESKNTSGVSGVNWHSRDKLWIARIGIAGQRKEVGRFQAFEEAVAARKAAERDHDYHENHGR